MIANMNEKGRQTKLLAAFAILAMVVCAFAVAMPSDGVDGITTPSEAAEFEGFGAEMTGTETAPKEYKLTENIVLDAASTIPKYNVLYTNGYTITADSTNTLTVSGTLYINGTNGALIVSATSDLITATDGSAKVIIDTNGALKVGNATTNVVWIGTGGYGVVNSGTVSIATNADGGYTATIDENSEVTLNDFTINQNDDVIVSENATLVAAGEVTGTGSITNNGEIEFSEDGTVLRALVSGNGVIQGYANGTLYGNITSVATFDASGALTTAVRLFGTDNANYTLATGGKISLAENGYYSGTISWSGKDSTGEFDVTQTVSLTISGTQDDAVSVGTNGLVIVGTGTTSKYTNTSGSEIDVMISSNITISDARATSTGVASTMAPITVSNVALSGSLNAPVQVDDNSATAGYAIIPTGSTLRMNQNASFAGEANGTSSNQKLVVLGYLLEGNNVTLGNQIKTDKLEVITDNNGKVSSFMTGTTNVVVVAAAVTQIISEAMLNNILTYAANGPVQLTDGTGNYVIQIKGELTLPSTTVYVPSNVIIVVGDWSAVSANYDITSPTVWTYGDAQRGTLTLNGTTIESTGSDGANVADGKDTIVVASKNSLVLNGAKVFAVVNADPELVQANNVQASYVNTTSRVVVGYGSTLDLSGDVETDITVYGNLVVTGDVTFDVKSEMNVYRGANLTIDGNLEILGEANFFDGSNTTVNGTILMDNGTDGATMTVGINPYDGKPVAGANFTIAAEGTVTLAAPNSGYTQYNTIIVNNGKANYSNTDRSWEPRFLIQGTLEVRGAIQGWFYDMGTVTVNGYVDDNATIVLFPGNSITVTSVTDGMLTITDDGSLSESDRVYSGMTGAADSARDVNDGNSVELTNVRNVTVSVAQDTVSYENSAGDNITDYYTVMDVSGTVSANREGASNSDSTVTIKSSVAATGAGVGKNNDVTGYVQISQAMTVGRSVTLDFAAGNTQVSGEITAIAQHSDTVTGSHDAEINNSADVTVTGHITVFGDEIDARSGINAMHYYVLNDDGALAHEIVEQFCGGRDGVSVGNHARVFGEIHVQSLFLRRACFLTT